MIFRTDQKKSTTKANRSPSFTSTCGNYNGWGMDVGAKMRGLPRTAGHHEGGKSLVITFSLVTSWGLSVDGLRLQYGKLETAEGSGLLDAIARAIH